MWWPPDYPDTKFVIIDEKVDQPNVLSIKFSEEEARISLAFWRLPPRKPALSASSAGWTFR